MRYTLALILFISALFSFSNSAAQEPDIKDIVLINSYHPSFKWTFDLTYGVMTQLHIKENYRVSIEFMDAKRFSSQKHLEALEEFLQIKYRNIKIDGVICSDNYAFEFFLKHGKKIWGNAPMTFCGVNNIKDFNIDTTLNKGVEETINIKKTLSLINKLQPNLDTLIVISDFSLSGVIFLKQFESTVKSDFPHLMYHTINALSEEQLSNELRKFNPKNKAIYLLSLYMPRDGISLEMINEAKFLSTNLDVPIYGNWDFLLDHFIVGGAIIGGFDQGMIAAKQLKEILSGNNDVTFLTPTPEKIIFDYNQMMKYGLNPDILPSQTEFINKPVSFIEKYKKELTILLIISGILFAVIIILIRIISLNNITKKKLQKSQSRLGLAMEGANLGLWDVDFINNDIFLSSKTSQLLENKSPNDININLHNWTNIIHPDDVDQLVEVFQMHSKNIIPSFRGEIRLLTDAEKYKWFSINGKIIDFKNGKPARMIGVLMNINLQKEFEEQLKIAKDRAEESDRLKSSFLANMSHEIRTPMNAILGFTDLVISGDINPEESVKYLKLIRNSGETLLNLINDIIDFSKIQTGQLSLRPETFDLNILLDNITMVASALIIRYNKKIKIVVKKGSANDSFLIIADPFRLEQVLYNLVNNAIKFTEAGEISIDYKIIDSKTISFSLKDSGIGVAPENQEFIFERFSQVEKSPSTNNGGTGLGLAISKSLLTLMGGTISVDSELNKGSTFTFTFSYKPISLIPGTHF